MTLTAAGLMSVDEALARVLAGVEPLADLERITPVELALGRVLAADVVAATSLPPWDNSAMDGYAVRAADTTGATEESPVRLQVIGEIRAGSAPETAVRPGTALRIATGAPMPPASDAVVQVELTTPVDAAGRSGARGREATGPLPAACLVHAAVSAGTSVRAAGGDVREGAAVVRAGAVVTPAVIALAAGTGAAEVLVRPRPVVAVLATGDELRPPGAPLGAAGIPDANGPGLRSLVREAGAEPLDLGIAVDRLEDVDARLRRGIASADVVIVSGGVSVGPYDVVRRAFEAVGEVDLWRVAVQPGKPFAFGRAGRVLLFGLPGNPVSSFVTFELFVRPVLRRLAGHERLQRPMDRAVLEEPVSKGSGRRGFQRVVALRDADGGLVRDASGRVRVRLAGGQGSHVISALAAADALAVVPEANDRLEAGAEVELRWLNQA